MPSLIRENLYLFVFITTPSATDERKFDDFLASLPGLTAPQKQRLEAALAGKDPTIAVTPELDAMRVSQCPHCAAGAPARNRRDSDLQGYKCHACRRTFNVVTARRWRVCAIGRFGACLCRA